MAPSQGEEVLAGETFGGVGAQRLEQPEPPLACLDERLLGQPGEQWADGRGGEATVAAHRARALEPEPAGEDGEPFEEQCLLDGQQVVGRVDHRTQGPVPGRSGTPATRQQVQLAGDVGAELADAERRGPRRTELDREGQPVEPPAEPGDVRQLAPP